MFNSFKGSFGGCAIFRSVRFNVQTYGLFFALILSAMAAASRENGLAYISSEFYIENMSGRKLYVLLLIFLFITLSLSAQTEIPGEEQERPRRDDWKKIHMAGFAYDHSYKLLEETIGDDTKDLKYRTHSFGLGYSSFSGARLGFVTDITALFPLITSYGSDSAESNSGFALDYLGSVGWRLELEPFELIPYVGFNVDYGFLSRDPVDNDNSNHMISLGLGTGIKAVYEIAGGKGVFLGLRGTWNSVEFSSADYDSREIQLVRKFTLTANAGYSWRPR